MGMFDRTTLNAEDIPAAVDLFRRIVEAEAEQLTAEQKANPRAYLIGAWREAAQAIIRPLQNVDDLVREGLEMERPSTAAPEPGYARI